MPATASKTFPATTPDDTPFLRQAVREYLSRERHLVICWPPPERIFAELPPDQQSEILARAQQLKTAQIKREKAAARKALGELGDGASLNDLEKRAREILEEETQP